MCTLGTRIKTKRKELGLTQKELGEKISLSEFNISKYERNCSTPDMETLSKLSTVLNCSLDYLYGNHDDNFSNLSLGKNLRSLRISIGLDQKQLANHLNINSSSISNWETNRRSPDLNTLVKLADFFDVSTDYLLGRTTTKNYILDDSKYLTLKLEKGKYPLELTSEELEKKLTLISKIENLFKNFGSTT